MKTIYFILIIFLLLSCKKEKNTTIKSDLTIFAGQVGDSINYFDFVPDIKVNYIDISCNNYYGIDSFVLNIDKNIDFQIIYHVVTPDLTGSCCPGGDCFPSGFQQIELKKFNSHYQIAIDSLHLIHKFNLNDKVSKNNNWDASSDIYFANVTFPKWDNNWLNSDNKYIGIRFIDTDTIYGWIRVSYQDTILLKDYAFKKKY